MELLTFILAMVFGLSLTFLAVMTKERILGLFGSVVIFLVSVSMMTEGLVRDVISVYVNASGSVTTNIVQRDMLTGALFTGNNVGLILMGLAAFIAFTSLFDWETKSIAKPW